ncbi:hypothetical protein [Vibrio nereis]|uniref:Uncharacterized protein n=1 Tax=Vibrio nereis TaxID=693 RepID=A0A0M0HSB6_VIBNE|nr:hypothetical protein [Vibrio nereis]KOO04812.1 hypothetical protein AKJ17_03865 [Vibrio nereis]
MLKNWTVIAEATKSVVARERYLKDLNHKNHRYTQQIINLYGDEKQSLNMIHFCEKYKFKQAQNRRGGRPPTPAMEFVLTLPKGIRPSAKQWRLMLRTVLNEIAKSLNIHTKELAPITRAVIHQQEQNTETKGSGDHLHLLIGKFTEDGHYLRDLQRKMVLSQIKNAFNQAVLEEMGIAHSSHTTHKPYLGQAKKRAPSWKVKAAREYEHLFHSQQELCRFTSRVLGQAEKWLRAFSVYDKKQMTRQLNRILREVEKLKLDPLALESNEVDQLHKLLDRLACNIESKSGDSRLKNQVKNKFCILRM